MNAVLEHLDAGTLIRGEWSGTDAQGRETVCLLAALVPGITSPSDCPADVMPQWLAHLTPSFDDQISLSGWSARMRRYGEASVHFRSLSPEAWDRCKWRTIDASLIVAEPHDTAGVVAPVRALIARQLAGDAPTRAEWEAAKAAADVAGAAVTPAEAAWAAAEAAWAADAADAAGAAAAAASVASVADEDDAALARAAGRAVSWDAIFDACMTAIEAEIEGLRK